MCSLSTWRGFVYRDPRRRRAGGPCRQRRGRRRRMRARATSRISIRFHGTIGPWRVGRTPRRQREPVPPSKKVLRDKVHRKRWQRRRSCVAPHQEPSTVHVGRTSSKNSCSRRVSATLAPAGCTDDNMSLPPRGRNNRRTSEHVFRLHEKVRRRQQSSVALRVDHLGHPSIGDQRHEKRWR